MMVIRPIDVTDIDELLKLAGEAGVGVTTLPVNRDLLMDKIESSIRSFNEAVEDEWAFYFFALEDVESGKLVGVSALDARVGLDDVWYNYRISTTVNSSKELGLHQATQTLFLTNDMTACSELCSLLLSKPYRHGDNGQLLSKCRFLFLADFKEKFSPKIFAEMRGYSDETGHSPFWEGLGRHFFAVDFSHADYLSGLGNKSFIAEMMPQYPIYVPFLSTEAQKCIAQVHDNTRPALAMLEGEGFNFNGFVDIFDAGPLVEAFVNNIRSVRDSFKRQAVVVKNPQEMGGREPRPFMVSNRSFSSFRVGLVDALHVQADTVSIPQALAEALQIESGDIVRLVELRNKKGVRK
ncbi:MAG: arginine N-succinyltransferase [Hahellaceae bacterium]|nr:arginine N-succinyltransferase [Hahellaceae bacterium]MCP5210996.1 arginine N-succinyltransferase [Hahellaceae bacterium]